MAHFTEFTWLLLVYQVLRFLTFPIGMHHQVRCRR